MVPIIPFLAWTGGIAAGAQVMGGVVRATGELVRGRPSSALLEVAGGVVAPVKSAAAEVSKLGHDVFMAVMKPWREPETEAAEPKETEEVSNGNGKRPRRRRQEAELESDSLDGMLSNSTHS